MAHGITNTDGMFSVREKPWHRLGVILPDLATAAEAITAANLGWKVEKVPAYFESTGTDGQRIYKPVDKRFVTIRTDTQEGLGTVGEWYKPLQNTEAFQFMDAVCQDPNGPKYVTAGSLHGGRRVWILAKMPSFVEATNKDIVEEYLLLSNSHDGSRAVEVRWTPIRVVCANTLSAALSKETVGKISLRHTGDIFGRLDEVQAVLGIARQNHELFSDVVDALRRYEPTKEQVNSVMESLFRTEPKKPLPATKPDTRFENTRRMVEQLYRDGEANTAAGDTSSAWAFYNGITEYIDHYRPTRVGDGLDRTNVRVESAWFGSSATKKVKALAEVLELVR